jgi:hypothetical protein
LKRRDEGESALLEEETSWLKVVENMGGPYDEELAVLGERDTPQRADHCGLNHRI